MRRLFIAAILSLLSAPAFAQQSLKQPATPDDGVGIDYTKPYVNDLLLRGDPRKLDERISEATTDAIREGSRQYCEKQFEAFGKDPANDALREVWIACRKKFREEVQPFIVKEFQRLRPGLQAEPYRVQPGPPPIAPRLPLSPNHPNAQN